MQRQASCYDAEADDRRQAAKRCGERWNDSGAKIEIPLNWRNWLRGEIWIIWSVYPCAIDVSVLLLGIVNLKNLYFILKQWINIIS